MDDSKNLFQCTSCRRHGNVTSPELPGDVTSSPAIPLSEAKRPSADADNKGHAITSYNRRFFVYDIKKPSSSHSAGMRFCVMVI